MVHWWCVRPYTLLGWDACAAYDDAAKGLGRVYGVVIIGRHVGGHVAGRWLLCEADGEVVE